MSRLTGKQLARRGKAHQFKKGEDPRRNVSGRPRKFVSALASEFGYKHQEVIDACRTLAAMTYNELVDVRDAKEATVLESTIARALIKARETGDLDKLEMVITRAFGSPKQTIINDEPEPLKQAKLDVARLSSQALREIVNLGKK